MPMEMAKGTFLPFLSYSKHKQIKTNSLRSRFWKGIFPKWKKNCTNDAIESRHDLFPTFFYFSIEIEKSFMVSTT